MTAAEMPWVTETRLAPGQRLRRSPVFGILAIAGAAIGGGLFVIAMGSVLLRTSVILLWLLPLWGVLMLGTIGCAIAALARRGRVNLSLGFAALGLLVVTNPLLPLILELSIAQ